MTQQQVPTGRLFAAHAGNAYAAVEATYTNGKRFAVWHAVTADGNDWSGSSAQPATKVGSALLTDGPDKGKAKNGEGEAKTSKKSKKRRQYADPDAPGDRSGGKRRKKQLGEETGKCTDQPPSKQPKRK